MPSTHRGQVIVEQDLLPANQADAPFYRVGGDRFAAHGEAKVAQAPARSGLFRLRHNLRSRKSRFQVSPALCSGNVNIAIMRSFVQPRVDSNRSSRGPSLRRARRDAGEREASPRGRKQSPFAVTPAPAFAEAGSSRGSTHHDLFPCAGRGRWEVDPGVRRDDGEVLPLRHRGGTGSNPSCLTAA